MNVRAFFLMLSVLAGLAGATGAAAAGYVLDFGAFGSSGGSINLGDPKSVLDGMLGPIAAGRLQGPEVTVEAGFFPAARPPGGLPQWVKLTAKPEHIAAGKKITLRAEVQDGLGRPVNWGGKVQFVTDNGTFDNGQKEYQATAWGGVATARLTRTDPGPATVTAAAGDLGPGSVEVAFTGTPSALSPIQAVPPRLLADGQSVSTLTVQVLDGYGQWINTSGKVTFSTNRGTLVGTNPAPVLNGTATIQLRSDPSPGTATVRARYGSLAAVTVNVPFVRPLLQVQQPLSGSPGEPVWVPLIVSDAFNVAGLQAALEFDGDRMVFVEAALGGQVEGHEEWSVTAHATSGRVTVILSSLLTLTSLPQPDGEALKLLFRVDDEAAVGETIDVPLRQVKMADAEGEVMASYTRDGTLTVTRPADVSRSQITASPRSVPVGETSTVRVTARDKAGQVLAGRRVKVETNRPRYDSLPPSEEEYAEGYTDAGGVATFTLTSTRSGRSTVKAADVTGLPLNFYRYATVDFTSTASRSFATAWSPGLYLMALPGVPPDPDPTTILGLEPENLQLATWDPAAQRYRYYFPPTARAEGPALMEIWNGMGYWLKLDQPATIRFQGSEWARDVPHLMALQPGWNLIGTPFGEPILWDVERLCVRRDEVEKSLVDAPEWISRYAWGWNGTEYQLVLDAPWVRPATEKVLQPWQGYWLKAEQACELVIPPELIPAAEGEASPPEQANRPRGLAPASDEWGLQLVATAGPWRDAANYLGQVRDERRTARRIESPPSFAGTLDLSFVPSGGAAADRSASHWAADLRPVVVPGTTWNLEVISRSPTEPVILTWPDVSRVPRGLRLRLVDLDTGRAVSLRTASHYTLSPGPDGVQCRLRIEAAAALNDRPLILQVQARPHRGGPATLEYTLSEAVDVRVRIGSVSGRPVRELAHPPGRAGLNAVVWDLRDDAGRPVPNGVYLCEVHAANTEQEQGQAVCVLEVRR